jgi:hypothetical protein
MKPEKANSEWLNVWVIFSGRKFLHLHQGNVIGNGFVVRGINKDAVEAHYQHEGENEGLPVVLNVTELAYDAVTRSGYVLGECEHDFSDLPAGKQA